MQKSDPLADRPIGVHFHIDIDGSRVAYAPEFDLSARGETMEDARNALHELIRELLSPRAGSLASNVAKSDDGAKSE